MSTIPVIDMSSFANGRDLANSVVDVLVHAVEHVGFFAITGHGITTEQLDEMHTLVAEVFSVSMEDKQRQAILRDNYRGFIPLGFFTPNRSDDPNSDTPADRYEGFKLHTEVDPADPICSRSAIYGPNRWADHPANMAEVVLDYWAACDRIANSLLRVFEHALGLDPAALTSRFDHPVTNMTLLHYPPSTPDENIHGIHPHKDTNVLTILHPDPIGGLFVRTRDGDWIEATCPEGALLVNTGDMMEVWSGGRFVSTPHKVVNTTGKQRYSFPWFLVPSHDEIIEPLVPLQPGFERRDGVEVGPWSLEVWRTNWPDAIPADDDSHLGTLDQ